MDLKLKDLLDIPLLENLQKKLNEVYSFPSALVDIEGKVLTEVAWQDICTNFHRRNPECETDCIKSDLYVSEHLHDANPAISYKCPRGLIEIATPIMIDGKHLGNFFTGQFFLEKPDIQYFRNQARRFGFEEKAYMEAVEKVPIWAEEKLFQYLDFSKVFIEMIAGIGLKNLREIESREALRKIEERNLAIIQSTSDWVWELDAQFNYCYCSERVESILGFTPDEIIGKSPFDLMLPAESARVGAIFQDIVERKGLVVDLENWNLHKDGREVCLLTNGFPIFDEAGHVSGYRGADKDITEHAKAEEEIRRKNEDLLKANAQKDKFLYIIAHDLRNPFNSLLGYTKMMAEELPTLTLEEIQQIAVSMRSSASKLYGLLGNLLEWSMMEGGITGFNPASLKLKDEIVRIVELFYEEASLKKIAISCEIPEDLIVMADDHMLGSVMRNLIGNAVKFTPRGGDIAIAARPGTGRSVEISIRDTGIGMNRGVIDRLFQLDGQANRSGTEGEPSTGLGLILCKSFIERHRGKIWAESEEGAGSTFSFTLPVS